MESQKNKDNWGKSTACVNKPGTSNVHGNPCPKLVVKLEKLDVAAILKVQKKPVRPDSNNKNTCNEKHDLKVTNHLYTMLIKEEKNNSGNYAQNSSSSSLSSAIEVKQEIASASTTKDPVPQKPQLHGSNQSKIYKPGAASRASKARSENSSQPKPSQANEAHNYAHFDGAAFFHFQMRTNIALQSILKDIVTLNKEYNCTDDHLLEVDIEKLRAKNKLPSLRILDPFTNIEVPESSEDSCPESDDDIGNLGKDSGFDNESQESESNSDLRKSTPWMIKDDLNTEEDLEDCKDTEMLRGRPEPDDEADYVDVEGLQEEQEQKSTEIISINGTLVELGDDALECPFCAKEFNSISSLKQHVRPCLDSKLSRSSSVQNQPKADPTSSIKIGRVFSLGKTSQSKGYARKKFRRTCMACDLTFTDKDFLEAHFRETGHGKVYPLMPCQFCKFVAFNPPELERHVSYGQCTNKKRKTQEALKMEIIELSD